MVDWIEAWNWYPHKISDLFAEQIVLLLKKFSFSKCRHVSFQQKDACVTYSILARVCRVTIRGLNRGKFLSSTARSLLISKYHHNNWIKLRNFYCSKTWLSHFRRAGQFVFDDTRGLYQTAVNWIQHTFRTSRVLLCNSLGTPDLPKLLEIWISHGPWNRKFSAPSSLSSKFENCVHPRIIGLNQGFVWRKVFLRKGVRPAPVPFPLFLGI